MNWEEACKYLWKDPITRNIFIFKVREDMVYYKTIDDSGWTRWGSLSHISPDINLVYAGYEIVGDNPEYIFITPQEKVCKKIAMMEQRWATFQNRKRLQERKHCG